MTFEWPWLLLGLGLVPLLVLTYIVAQKRRKKYTMRFTNLALLSQVAGKRSGWRRHIPPALYLLGLAILLVSLARPTAVIAVPREQAAIMVVLDVSGSMGVEDLQPDRMTAAKQAVQSLAKNLPAEMQLGLVSFNTEARLNMPLSRDREAFLTALNGLRAEGGTAIGEGLNTALENLQRRSATDSKEPAPPASIVLLSDGRSTNGRAAEQVAVLAQEQAVKVYTVGIGDRNAQPRVRGGGQLASLDETTLKAIAETTNGQYFYARETSELKQVYNELGSQVGWREERTEITSIVGAAAAVILIGGGLLSMRWFRQLP